MPKYNFDEIVSRANSNSMKYDAGTTYNSFLPEDHIPMWVADMDFACPQPMLDAMHARLDRRILGYSNYSSTLGNTYFDAVCGWLKRRHGMEAARNNIAFAVGVVSATYAAVNTMTEKTDSVVIFTPSYQYIYDPIWKNGRTPVKIPLINNDGYYTIDFAALRQAAARPEVTLLILCSPHNPSGRVWTEEELRTIAEICFANNVRIFVDEIHNDLTRRSVDMISLSALYPKDPRIVTAMSTSKTFNCAANHHAYMVVYDAELKSRIENDRNCGTMNPLAVEAVIAAYNECEDWVDELQEYIDGNFAYLDDYIRKNLPRAKFRIAEGTYLAWIDLSGYGMTSDQLNEVISKQGLYLEYGGEFVENDEGHARMNMACPRSTVEKACARLKKALEV